MTIKKTTAKKKIKYKDLDAWVKVPILSWYIFFGLVIIAIILIVVFNV